VHVRRDGRHMLIARMRSDSALARMGWHIRRLWRDQLQRVKERAEEKMKKT